MLKSTNVAGARPAVYPDEAVVALCSLPAGCIPLDFTLIVDDLDSGTPAIVLNGGGISAAEDSVDRVMISASTVAQGGGVARSTLFPMVAPVETETLFGIHITTAPATAQAGTIRGILTYRAEEYGG